MKIEPDKVKVADVMQTSIVTLDLNTPVERAFAMFKDYGISGAPVIDENGSLCGVFTTADVLPLSPSDDAPRPNRSPTTGKTDASPSTDESPSVLEFSRGAAGHGRVEDWMTREILTVEPDATLGEVCDLMNRETVHRVFVTDGASLLGVVAASDIVSYVAKSSSAWSGDEWV